MDFCIRDIARELGCSEDALCADYQDAIDEGRTRWNSRPDGDLAKSHRWRSTRLRHLNRKLNNAELLFDRGKREKFKLPGDPGGKARSQARKTLRKRMGAGQRKWMPTENLSGSHPSREFSKRINDPDRILTEETFDKLQ
jgi:hypothetical protein